MSKTAGLTLKQALEKAKEEHSEFKRPVFGDLWLVHEDIDREAISLTVEDLIAEDWEVREVKTEEPPREITLAAYADEHANTYWHCIDDMPFSDDIGKTATFVEKKPGWVVVSQDWLLNTYKLRGAGYSQISEFLKEARGEKE